MLHQKLSKVEQSKYVTGDEKERNVFLMKISSKWSTLLCWFFFSVANTLAANFENLNYRHAHFSREREMDLRETRGK